MVSLEQLLYEEKERFDNIQVPNNLGEKLKMALDDRSSNRKRRPYLMTAAIVVIIFLLSYNMNTLAFYAKKFVGYDNVMSEGIQDLNSSGRGQIVDKTYSFDDGVSVTLDGVMLDANNLVLFYTITDPNKNVQDVSSRMRMQVLGFLDRPMGYGGAGERDSEGVHERWVVTTNRAPKFYDRTITLDISYLSKDNDVEHGEIKFKLDRNTAVGKSITIPINKEVKLKSNNSINVESMVATPTATVIKGKLQNILQLGLDKMIGEEFSIWDIEMAIYADEVEVPKLGSSLSTNMKGRNFEIRFDRLPQKVNTLEVKLTSFVNSYELDELIPLEKGEEKTVEIMEQVIDVEEIYEKNGKTYVTLSSDEYTSFPKVSLIIDGEEQRLISTRPIEIKKDKSEDEKKVYYTRILEFDGRGDDLMLHVERISFRESFNEVIFSREFEQ